MKKFVLLSIMAALLQGCVAMNYQKLDAIQDQLNRIEQRQKDCGQRILQRRTP